MNRKEFKNLLVEKLESKGIEIDVKKIESAMCKTAIHARNKYGNSNWNYEYEECGVGNAVIFYNEYKVKDTFNRSLYRQ
jgi:hypothetical protein